MKVINIHKTTNLKAIGTHINGNSKPIFNITTGAVYASVKDAAQQLGMAPSGVSKRVTGQAKRCKGPELCFVSKIVDNLDRITATMQINNIKAAKYDEIHAKEMEKKQAAELLARRQESYDKLCKKLEDEKRLLEEAQAAAVSMGLLSVDSN